MFESQQNTMGVNPRAGACLSAPRPAQCGHDLLVRGLSSYHIRDFGLK